MDFKGTKKKEEIETERKSANLPKILMIEFEKIFEYNLELMNIFAQIIIFEIDHSNSELNVMNGTRKSEKNSILICL